MVEFGIHAFHCCLCDPPTRLHLSGEERGPISLDVADLYVSREEQGEPAPDMHVDGDGIGVVRVVRFWH